jgi:hypothetical protein
MNSSAGERQTDASERGRSAGILDDAGRLTHTILCIECGYNLRGLTRGGRCPECDTPIERSLRGDALQYASLAWLRTVRRGLRWIAVSAFIGVMLLIAGIFLLNTPLLQLASRPAGVGQATVLLLISCAGILGAGGLLLATTHEPRRAAAREGSTPRVITRYLTLSTLVFTGLFFTTSAIGFLRGSVAKIGGACVLFAGGAVIIAFSRYLIKLLVRTVHRRAVVWARNVANVIAATLILVLGSWLLGWVPQFFGWRQDVFVGGLGSCGRILGIVGILGFCLLVLRVERLFARLVQSAEGGDTA